VACAWGWQPHRHLWADWLSRQCGILNISQPYIQEYLYFYLFEGNILQTGGWKMNGSIIYGETIILQLYFMVALSDWICNWYKEWRPFLYFSTSLQDPSCQTGDLCVKTVHQSFPDSLHKYRTLHHSLDYCFKWGSWYETRFVHCIITTVLSFCNYIQIPYILLKWILFWLQWNSSCDWFSAAHRQAEGHSDSCQLDSECL
jgi:hypothetical protein